jgi:hypothetical protein
MLHAKLTISIDTLIVQNLDIHLVYDIVYIEKELIIFVILIQINLIFFRSTGDLKVENTENQ